MSKKVGQSDASPDGESVEWPRPIYDRSWMDPSGAVWRMRGPVLGRISARRAMRQPNLRVVHAYGLEVAELEGEAKEAVLGRVEQYLAGDAPPHSFFELGTFRDDDRQTVLVVQESC